MELATFLPNTLYTSRAKPLLFKISVPLNDTPLSERTGFIDDITTLVADIKYKFSVALL